MKPILGLPSVCNKSANPSDFLPDLNEISRYLSNLLQRIEKTKPGTTRPLNAQEEARTEFRHRGTTRQRERVQGECERGDPDLHELLEPGAGMRARLARTQMEAGFDIPGESVLRPGI